LAYKKGDDSYQTSRDHAQNLVNRLNQKKKKTYNSSNRSYFEKYWQKKYSRRVLISPQSQRNDYLRAIEALGDRSIRDDERELQHCVDRAFRHKPKKHARICAHLNRIFDFYKIDTHLMGAPQEWEEVTYITIEDLPKVLSFISNPLIKLIHSVAFATGCRVGEIFAIMPEHIKGRTLDIKTQIDINLIRRKTKNKKARAVTILDGYEDDVLKWASIPSETRLKMRRRSFSLLTRKASKKALGRSIRFHDLRHSYAIHCASKGVSISDIASLIGDTIKTTERFYLTFIATPETLKRVEKLI
jgi:integrase